MFKSANSLAYLKIKGCHALGFGKVVAAVSAKNFFISRKIIAVKTKDMSEILSLWATCLRTFFSEILLMVWQK